MLLRLLSLCLLVLPFQALTAGVGPAPVESEVRSKLNAKIIELKGEWVVLLSDKTVLVLRNPEDQLRLKDLMLRWGKDNIPPYVLLENLDYFYPYKLLFTDIGAEFALIKPREEQYLWILVYGESSINHIAEKNHLNMTLNRIDGEEVSEWKIENSFAEEMIAEWSTGDIILVVDVYATTKNYRKLAGQLAFKFDSVDDAKLWQQDESTYYVKSCWISRAD